jgi:hypothetical protein
VNWSRIRLLSGLIGFLAVILALEWLLPDPPPPAGTPVALLRSRPPAAIATRDTGDWVETVLARPVFSISRRPPKVAAGGHAETAAGEARLSGIMITRAGRRAIFAPEGGGKPLVLAEGASVNQSTIRSILADRVVLAGGAVLRPSYDRNRSNQTTPPFFQTIQQNFPAAPNPYLPNFAQPNFPQPGLQPPQAGGDDGTPPPPTPLQPMQPFRGNMIPPRRE